ncbi:MAG TPA: hypothetical protein VFP82_07220 [Chthoniobacterales bacterium]|nr:hypothetical protein [Chthoniobacterales bacterium]
MRKLANLIETELKQQEICAVYDSELARIWPQSMNLTKRKEQIKRFAKQHELAVTFYDVGLCAIFEKARAPAQNGKRMLLLEGQELKRSRKRRR